MTAAVDPTLVAAAFDAEAAALTASRARIATSADESRRRIQRELHLGAQQRLTHAIMALRLARDALARGQAPDDLLDEALAHAGRASVALGTVVRDVLPPILVHAGLRAGLESLVADLGLAAELRVTAPRLPAAVETTVYLVVAEALTNAARHACAGRVRATVALVGDVLVAEVVDDGVGGADPARGGGLTGVADRVAAAGGTWTLTSPPGGGTALRVVLSPAPAG